MRLAASGHLVDGSLARVTASASGSRMRAALDVTLSAEGVGLSPRGLATVLTGSGTATLGEGAIDRLLPATIDAVARLELAEPGELDTEEMKRQISDRRRMGSFALAPASVPLTIADGQLRIGEVVADQDEEMESWADGHGS